MDMSYQSYLLFLSQLSSKKIAKILIEDRLLLIKYNSLKKICTLSTKVYQGQDCIPSSIYACVSSSGTLKWQEKGAYLILNSFDHSVCLVQHCSPLFKYLPFKYTIKDFLSVAKEWETILCDFAEKDSFSMKI